MKKKDEEKYLTAKELNEFFEKFEEQSKIKKGGRDGQSIQYKTLFTLLVMTGIRIGEALALNWSDIDFNKQILTINKTQVELKRKVTVSTPKTADSNRVIPINSQYLLELLKEWKVAQKKIEEKFKRENSEYSGIVFL